MFKQIVFFVAVLAVAFAAPSPNPKAKPDFLAPLVAETPVVSYPYADYVAPLAYSTHYSAPLTAYSYSAYPYPVYASSYYY